MASVIRISLLTGPHSGRRFCMRGPTQCTVGRGEECALRLSGKDRDMAISRRHCRLDFDPPCLRLQDLGSLNGTYRNGKRLPADESALADEAIAPTRQLSVVENLEDGDIVTLGSTTLKVNWVDCRLDAPDADPSLATWPADQPTKADCPVQC